MYAGKKLRDELTTCEILKLLDVFSSHGGKKVTFTGGEIMMRDDLRIIIEHSHSLGIRNELLTNGTLWTEKQICEFAPMIDKVQISIDGYSEETNSIVRGKGNFSKSLDAIDLFVKSGVRTEVAITPLFDEDYKKDYMKYALFGEKMIEKYNDYDFKVKFSGVILDGRDVSYTNEQKEEYKIIAEKIYNALFGNVDEFQFVNFHKMQGIQDNCNYGNLTITANGDLYLCPQIPMVESFGNLRQMNFEDIMQVVNKAKAISVVDNILPCKGCELKYICGGDCRIKYFPQLASSNIMKLSSPPIRKCSKEIKEKFYDLMIETNEKIFQDTGS
jgi:radical SAM protein with 4Fe4S-binding SPASM domain